MALRDRITQAQDNALQLELAGLTPTARASAICHTLKPPALTLYFNTRSGTETHAVTIAPDGTTSRTTRINL